MNSDSFSWSEQDVERIMLLKYKCGYLNFMYSLKRSSSVLKGKKMKKKWHEIKAVAKQYEQW